MGFLLFFLKFCLICIIIVATIIILYEFIKPSRFPIWTKGEKEFVDPIKKTSYNFPSILVNNPTVTLSVLINCYNEEKRLTKTMEEIIDYLSQRKEKDPNFSWEIVILDDFSKDKTSEIALNFSKKYTTDNIRLLRTSKNHGKGGGVQKGAIVCRGRYILLADADGATKFEDLENLEKEIKKVEKNGFGISIGSRKSDTTVVKRTLLRKILMIGFHILVSFLVKGIKDTQCGFKLITHKAAKQIMPNLRIQRWSTDVELLYLAQHIHLDDFDSESKQKDKETQNLTIPIAEVPVNWIEMEGSKVSVLKTSVEMGWDILRMFVLYSLGIWKIKLTDSIQKKKEN